MSIPSQVSVSSNEVPSIKALDTKNIEMVSPITYKNKVTFILLSFESNSPDFLYGSKCKPATKIQTKALVSMALRYSI